MKVETEEDRLAREHLWLTYRVARVAAARSKIGFEDARCAALEGLMFAAREFDPSRGVSFVSWAKFCMFTTIADEGRAMGFVPKRVYRAQREAGEVTQFVDVTEEEIYDSIVDETPPAEEVMVALEVIARVREEVKRLPPRERHVIEQVFFKGRMLEEAGKSRGRGKGESKSWMCRVKQKGLATLRKRLSVSGYA